MVTCLPPIWQHFATLQNRCNSATLNSQAWGADEAIEVILDEMADGIFETNPPLMFRRFDSLQSNRSKKYSQRRQILAKRPSAGSTGSGRLELSHMAACRETLQNAQKQVRLEDWQLLLAIGVGYTYQEVAEHVGQSPQYLKPKVSRLRAHLMKIISGNEISNKLISIATIVPKTLSLQTGHKMMSKEKTLAEFQLFSLGTGGIGSWLTPETDDRVFQRLAGIETEPLTMVQLNQLLAFGHEAPVSDDFFRYYWRDVPAEHPYEVSKLPDFQEAWLKCSAIISLPHLKWGLYRIFTDGLLYFGNVRTAYRELRSMTRPELVAFFGKHRFNTGLIKARGPALPLEIIPRDDRYLISEMACKSYGDSPESSGELKDALLQALRDHIGKGGGTISIRRLLDGSTVPDHR